VGDNTNAHRVEELINAGWTVLDVAYELRISPQAVYKHLAKLGMHPQPIR